MNAQRYIVSLVVVAFTGCLWIPTQVSASEHKSAELTLTPAAGMDRKMLEGSETSYEKKMAEADLRQDQMVLPARQDDSRSARVKETDPGYRPLCGPSKNAINHVYCAPGYDSW
jgi:hypothetical protein